MAAQTLNPYDTSTWANVERVALSPRGREVARRIARKLEGGK